MRTTLLLLLLLLLEFVLPAHVIMVQCTITTYVS
jgi:hypothetical protein